MTKRKKELVVLMYEAGIREFPEGGEFAVQDKLVSYANCVSFFKHARPKIDGVNDVWREDGAGEYLRGESIELSSLCKNWHRTVVTREQYDEYCKMREREESACACKDLPPSNDIAEAAILSSSTNAPEGGRKPVDVPVSKPKPSIIDMMHRCNELRDVAKQKADQATAAVGDYNDAMESLKAYALALGYNIEPIDVSGELSPSEEAEKPLNITDWRDLRVGDVIEAANGGWMQHNIGASAVVNGIDGSDPSRPIRALFNDEAADWGRKFKFIRRP